MVFTSHQEKSLVKPALYISEDGANKALIDALIRFVGISILIRCRILFSDRNTI